MRNIDRRKIYIIIAILIMIAIFIGSSLNGNQVKDVKKIIPFNNSVAHYIEYAILGFFVSLSIKPKKHWIIYTFIFCLIFAITDEYHQSFVSGRVPDYMDIFIDTLGVITSETIIKLTAKNPH